MVASSVRPLTPLWIVFLVCMFASLTPAGASGHDHNHDHDGDHDHDHTASYLVSILDQGGSDNNVTGVITVETMAGPSTYITGIVSGLSPGLHGFHIHSTADFSDGCSSTGGHWNPNGTNHGAPSNPMSEKHMGDLGNIEADGSGVAFVEITIGGDLMSSLGNQSFVVHAGEDDLGLGGAPDSLTTGAAGGRLKCGAITPFEPIYAEAMLANGPDTSAGITGKVHMEQKTPYHLYVKGNISGIPAGGSHGWHIHTGPASDATSCGPEVTAGHYNPLGRTHSGPQSPISEKHVGDFGNIVADASGAAEIDTSAMHTYLWGPYSVLDRAWVLHAGEDDLGLGGNDGSLATGNAGGRIKCGTISKVDAPPLSPSLPSDDSSASPSAMRTAAIASLAAAAMLLMQLM